MSLTTNCLRNSTHKEFIPMCEFKEHHIPLRYQHPDIVDLIKCLGTLTVRLQVNKISPQRPDPPYPPNPRVDRPIRGSGHVSDAIMYIEDDGKICPCQECQSSAGAPKTSWGKIYIHTAAPVVHDNFEALNTTCYFFYDDVGNDKAKVVKRSGFQIVEVDIIKGYSLMVCYTHDIDFLSKLRFQVILYKQLHKRVKKVFPGERSNENDKQKLTIIVSYPHGCGSYVTVGEYVNRIEDTHDPDVIRYTYTTPACPGSGGAPIFILEEEDCYINHYHVCTYKRDTKLNMSTYGKKFSSQRRNKMLAVESQPPDSTEVKKVPKGEADQVSNFGAGEIYSGNLSARKLMLFKEKQKRRASTVPTRDDQDNCLYHVEINGEGGDSLRNRKRKCEKHPGHKPFIPVKDFTVKDLPSGYQNQLIKELIQYLGVLTIRLQVNKISPHRPDPPHYPPPQPRIYPINGSGHVSDAVLYNGDDGKTCPCRECQSSGAPRTSWGKVYIHTAAHVVHDDFEAANTTCYFFDDDDDEHGKVISISGFEQVEIDRWEDRSWMVGYTHDLGLLETLHSHAEYYEELLKQTREVKFIKDKETGRKLTIIVSHPHGCCKCVTVGEYVDRIQAKDDPDWVKYTYNTPTCPGSSGAPVFVLGKDGWLDYHHHSGSDKVKSLNYSTYGLF